MEEIKEFTGPAKLLEYVNSPKSAITLKSMRTGLAIDYVIKREFVDPSGDMDILWIRSELGASWQLMGRIDCEIFSALRPQSIEARAFAYVWNALQSGEMAAGIKVCKTPTR